MPYLGNIPAENYASFDKQTITGDGGTSYTLTHPVGSAQEVAIFVNNVRQEPGVAYTVTGTALTMTGDVESTDDFYAIFIGKAVQTVEIPEKATNGDYDFDNGTLFVDASTNRVGVANTSPATALDVTGTITSDGADLDGAVVINESSADVDFRVESNGDANMLVVDGGNNSVGIGVAAGSQESNAFFHSGGPGLFVKDHTSTAPSGNVSYLAGDQGLAIVNSDGTTNTATSRLGFTVTTTGANSDSIIECASTAAGTSQLRFFNENGNTIAERFRIGNTGDVFFNQFSTSSPGLSNTTQGAVISDTGRVFSSVDGAWSSFNRNTDNGDVMHFRRSGTLVGSISVTASSTAYNTSSDYRLKENVADLTGAIARVKQLAPKRFNFIADPDDTTVDGFLAHEAQTVVPEAVTGTHNGVETWTQLEIDNDEAPDGTSAGDNKLDGDGNTIPEMQGIDQAKLVPLLVGALKESIAKIETLETEMTALKARVTTLENA